MAPQADLKHPKPLVGLRWLARPSSIAAWRWDMVRWLGVLVVAVGCGGGEAGAAPEGEDPAPAHVVLVRACVTRHDGVTDYVMTLKNDGETAGAYRVTANLDQQPAHAWGPYDTAAGATSMVEDTEVPENEDRREAVFLVETDGAATDAVTMDLRPMVGLVEWTACVDG